VRAKRTTTPIGGCSPPKKALHGVKPQPPIPMFAPTVWARTGVVRGWLQATGWTLGLECATRGRAEIPAPGANRGMPGLYDLRNLCNELGMEASDVVRQIRQWAASKGARWEGDDDPRCPAGVIQCRLGLNRAQGAGPLLPPNAVSATPAQALDLMTEGSR
jgi:hypothetical protein